MFGKKNKGKKGEEAEAEASAKPEADGEASEGGGKKKLPLKLIIIGAAALLVVLGGGGGAAYFLVLKPKAGAHGEEAAGHAEEKGGKAKSKEKGGGHGGGEEAVPGAGTLREGPEGVVFYTLPNFQTNLQSTNGRPNHLSLKITFELTSEDQAHLIEEQMPRVQDLLQTFLRELRPEDLNGSQGNYRLRQEIQRRINLVIAPAEVNAVLIEEMLQT